MTEAKSKYLTMESKTRTKVIVIPDVHGREFWRGAIEKYKDFINHQMVDVVFLGDYLDPYPFEGVSVEKAIEIFKEIIEFARDKTNVHLLLGNHDMHYFDKFYSESIHKVRYSHAHAKEIAKLFTENKSLFRVAWETRVNDKKILFTHAGILKTWAEVHMGKLKVRHGCIDDKYKIKSILPNEDSLNSLLRTKKGILSLGDISEERGGWYAYGSPIWADFREHLDSLQWCPPGRDELCNYAGEVYQVFGHSLGYPFGGYESLDMCYIDDHFAMLDSRMAFVILDDGSIHEVDDNIENYEKSEVLYMKKPEEKQPEKSSNA